MPVNTTRFYLYSSLCMFVLYTTAIANPEEAIARCSKIASVGDRILCLEDALREHSRRAPAESVIESPDSPVEAVAGIAPVAIRVQPSTEIPPAESPAAIAKESVGRQASAPSESAAAALAVTKVTGPEVNVEETDWEDEIGADQVRARTATLDEREAELESASGQLVAEYKMVPYERLVVTLENGQVWRQIKGDVQRIRVNLKKNQTVDIRQSRLGGYQLRLNEIRRTIRVERIR